MVLKHPIVIGHIYILLFVVSSQVGAQIVENKPFYYKAKVVSAKNNEPIVFANIINMKSHFGAISDTGGIFIIKASIGDMLMISSIGYEKKYQIIADSSTYHFFTPQIYLNEEVYKIGNVDVHFLGTYEDFKYRVLHTKVKDDPYLDYKNRLLKEANDIARYPQSDMPGIRLNGPLTAIYNLFSKEGKEMRKLADAMEKQPNENIINSKYNRKILEDATGLKDAELDEFVLFCRPSDSFILGASDYEIHEQIQQCLERFKNRNKEKEKKKVKL